MKNYFEAALFIVGTILWSVMAGDAPTEQPEIDTLIPSLAGT